MKGYHLKNQVHFHCSIAAPRLEDFNQLGNAQLFVWAAAEDKRVHTTVCNAGFICWKSGGEVYHRVNEERWDEQVDGGPNQ